MNQAHKRSRGGPMNRLFLVLSFVLLTAGCGTEPDPINLNGNWIASWTNLNGSGVTCNVTGVHLSLTHSAGAATFSGTYNGGTITCSGPGGTASGSFQPGTIVSGSLSGNTVNFDLNASNERQTGSVTGSSMSGTAVWSETLDNGSTIALNGSWSAHR